MVSGAVDLAVFFESVVKVFFTEVAATSMMQPATSICENLLGRFPDKLSPMLNMLNEFRVFFWPVHVSWIGKHLKLCFYFFPNSTKCYRVSRLWGESQARFGANLIKNSG